MCGKRALHPFNQEEAALHAAECTTRHDRLQARLRSADVECCICLEKVWWLREERELDRDGSDGAFDGLISG